MLILKEVNTIQSYKGCDWYLEEKKESAEKLL